MVDLKSPETCKICGGHVHFYPIEGSRAAGFDKEVWKIFNLDWSPHTCLKPGALKIYTEAEKQEFARKREKK